MASSGGVVEKQVVEQNEVAAEGGLGDSNVDDSGTDPHSLQELTSLIQTLLQQTQDRFQTMSDQIIKRIDDMGKRIDDLEKNINDLMTQVGVEQQAE